MNKNKIKRVRFNTSVEKRIHLPYRKTPYIYKGGSDRIKISRKTRKKHK